MGIVGAAAVGDASLVAQVRTTETEVETETGRDKGRSRDGER